MNERKEQLLAAVDHLIETWNAWSADDDLRYITRGFEEAVEDCLGMFADGTIPGDLRELSHRVDSLVEHWEAWKEKNAATSDKVLLPMQAFWASLEAIEDARREGMAPVRRPLETIAQLDAQKVPDRQICMIYGFVDESGQPLFLMLQEEREQPGRHTGPQTGWKPPHHRRQEAEESRQAESLARLREARAKKVADASRIAPESIKELVAQGVTGRQICTMKKMGREDLEAYCRENSLPVQWEPEGVYGVRGDFDIRPEEEPPKQTATPAASDSAGEDASGSLTLEQEIAEYAKAGLAEEQIAEAVSSPAQQVSAAKVRAVLKRWRKDPAAFDTAEVT